MPFHTDPEDRHLTVVETLRSTFNDLEIRGDLDPADPAVVELKNSILRTIGELERKKMERSELT